MKQTARIISTYSPDVFGICSALFELGGMVIMHDASGCNSTYNTHDEPRWYDMDSMVYISGLSEMEAVMGDDEKLINDIVSAAKELSPRFIAVAGTPIPMMIGTDFSAMAKVIETRTGIPSFGFDTNGMHSYIKGVSAALLMLAEHFTDRNVKKAGGRSANILGLTPLDFSVNGTDISIRKLLESEGYNVISSWAMGSSLEEIGNAGAASVNLVVSAGGLKAAERLRELYGTPYVVGLPVGKDISKKILSDMENARKLDECIVSYIGTASEEPESVIIAESVYGASLAAAIKESTGENFRVICPVECCKGLLRKNDVTATDEDELIPYIKTAKHVIGDPLHKPLCKGTSKFISLPSEAFSGRIFRKDIPNLCENFELIEKEIINHE